MPSPALLLNSVCPSSFSVKPSKVNTKIQYYPRRTKLQRRQDHRCRGYSSSSGSSLTDLDLYELLGVDSSSDQAGIKRAYRALQKRCHPDIAGPTGHDMAIILNEVYALLSDPSSRSAYDQEQAKLSELRGYTGKPLYSTWCGSDTEERAVFVDEVKCVGCLKCALFASKTFAVESAYGRARVVAQWADPEDKIFNAIQTCPVDCISTVERSNLAALEFLMSKQPRGNVRMTSGNTVGARVSNIFTDVDKFQRRYNEMKDKASKKESKGTDLQKESRISALQGIRSISNWWYWHSPATTKPMTENNSLILAHNAGKSSEPDMERLREAAAKCKARQTGPQTSVVNHKYLEEYWSPLHILPSPVDTSNNNSSSKHPPSGIFRDRKEGGSAVVVTDEMKGRPISLTIPFAMAVISTATVGLKGGEMNGGGLTEHIGGMTALEVVNSFELQVLLAGMTWFIIGMAMVGLVEALGTNMFRK